MSKLLITLLFAAFATAGYAADTDRQTDGAELGTQETPQEQGQSKNTKKSSGKHTKKHHSNTKAKQDRAGASNSEDNPVQPTDAESAPGASTR